MRQSPSLNLELIFIERQLHDTSRRSVLKIGRHSPHTSYDVIILYLKIFELYSLYYINILWFICCEMWWFFNMKLLRAMMSSRALILLFLCICFVNADEKKIIRVGTYLNFVLSNIYKCLNIFVFNFSCATCNLIDICAQIEANIFFFESSIFTLWISNTKLWNDSFIFSKVEKNKNIFVRVKVTFIQNENFRKFCYLHKSLSISSIYILKYSITYNGSVFKL